MLSEFDLRVEFRSCLYIHVGVGVGVPSTASVAHICGTRNTYGVRSTWTILVRRILQIVSVFHERGERMD